MKIQRIHHVAYRCNDAKETMEFYRNVMGMDFKLAIAEDKVPSTQAPDPYMHIFMDAGNNNVLAFFEVPNSPPMQKDPNTPEWVQHIAFEVKDIQSLMAAKERVEAEGLEVLGLLITPFLNPFISLIQTATGWNWPLTPQNQECWNDCMKSLRI